MTKEERWNKAGKLRSEISDTMDNLVKFYEREIAIANGEEIEEELLEEHNA